MHTIILRVYRYVHSWKYWMGGRAGGNHSESQAASGKLSSATESTADID
jgi:hypothetical protein